MNIVFDTNNLPMVLADGKGISVEELDKIILNKANELELNLTEYAIDNKYLRAILRKDNVEYHILEKPQGIYKIYCKGENNKKKALKFKLPYTIMIIKMTMLGGGRYVKKGDRIFHSDEPIKQDLSNKLWRWSLSNVYPGHNICWGKEKMPDIDRESTYRYMDEFFLGIKNNDLLENKQIDWVKMDPSIIHEINLRDITKVNLKLKDYLDGKDF